MKIELKSVQFFERMSDETNCFVANLYIDGKKVGEVQNDGRGGETFIHGFSKEDNKKIDECNKWCKSQGDHKFTIGNTEYSRPNTLDCVVDDLFEDWLKNKETQKMKKKFKNCIVIGKPNSNTYSYWNLKKPLSDIPQISLQRFITETVLPKCENGIEILNDNLEELGITFKMEEN